MRPRRTCPSLFEKHSSIILISEEAEVSIRSRVSENGMHSKYSFIFMPMDLPLFYITLILMICGQWVVKVLVLHRNCCMFDEKISIWSVQMYIDFWFICVSHIFYGINLFIWQLVWNCLHLSPTAHCGRLTITGSPTDVIWMPGPRDWE